jgi:hypothetical protein
MMIMITKQKLYKSALKLLKRRLPAREEYQLKKAQAKVYQTLQRGSLLGRNLEI